jgi:hypothetical protein
MAVFGPMFFCQTGRCYCRVVVALARDAKPAVTRPVDMAPTMAAGAGLMARRIRSSTLPSAAVTERHGRDFDPAATGFVEAI